MAMPKQVPSLPEELARKILDLSSCRDICSATMACKDLYYIATAISLIEASPSMASMASLHQFLTRRMPLGLKVTSVLAFRSHQAHACTCTVCRMRCSADPQGTRFVGGDTASI